MISHFSITFRLQHPDSDIQEDIKEIISAYLTSREIPVSFCLDHERFFSFQYKGHMVSLRYRDIIFFVRCRNKVEVHSTRGTFAFYHTMSALEKLLDPRLFVRVHQSYIVNLSKIRVFTNSLLILGPLNVRVPISKRKSAAVKRIVHEQ